MQGLQLKIEPLSPSFTASARPARAGRRQWSAGGLAAPGSELLDAEPASGQAPRLPRAKACQGVRTHPKQIQEDVASRALTRKRCRMSAMV
jgi:hypothetical protein